MGALVHLAEQREIQAEADFVFLLEWMKLGGWLMVLEWVCNGCNYKLIFRTIFSTLFSYLVKRFILKSILSESHVESFVLFYIQHASNWQLGNVATLICRNWSFISGCYFCLLKNSTQQNCWFTTDSGWNFDFPRASPCMQALRRHSVVHHFVFIDIFLFPDLWKQDVCWEIIQYKDFTDLMLPCRGFCFLLQQLQIYIKLHVVYIDAWFISRFI